MNRQIWRSIFLLLTKTISSSPILFYHRLVIFREKTLIICFIFNAFYNNWFTVLVALTVCVDGIWWKACCRLRVTFHVEISWGYSDGFMQQTLTATLRLVFYLFYHFCFCTIQRNMRICGTSVCPLYPFFLNVIMITGTAVAQWLRYCATNRKVAGSIPAGVSGFFIDIKSFRSHYGPGVDLVSNRNENQEYFLGVKAAGT